MNVCRAVIDTNIWVYVYLQNYVNPPPTARYADILAAFNAGEFKPVYSLPMFEELLELLTESYTVAQHYKIDPVKAGAFVGRVWTKAGEEQQITDLLKVCSDPRDDMFIETAYLGKVEYLVSNDEDLYEPAVRALLDRVGVKVIRPSSFRAELRRRRELG